jgi:hypothetical protein
MNLATVPLHLISIYAGGWRKIVAMGLEQNATIGHQVVAMDWG